MTSDEFDFVRKLLAERTAIVLEPGKEYLVENRLAPVIRNLKLGSLSEFIARLRTPGNQNVVALLIEAMVTTETSFFRDIHPFESLRKVVFPELIRRRAAEKSINIWCMASSTGQEPYSLAILLREHFPELRGWKIFFLATDLSRDVLARARDGRYNQIEVNRGLSAALLVKYFQQHGTQWQLNEDVRRLVEYRELNLCQPWPFLPKMDLILNRNVMIYFDVAMKKNILSRVARILRPDGYLLLGGSETTFNIDDSFQRIDALRSGFYQLSNGAKS